ncbi:MAG: hypothetical protein ACRDOO_01870, partial [Actinomadura sp.]
QAWLSASMTLFIVALAMLFIVERDQRRAVRALESAAAEQPSAAPEKPAEEAEGETDTEETEDEEPSGPDIAQVERGRIAAFSGVIALLWLVILFLMVWNGG